MGIVKDYERMCSDIGKSLKGFLRSCPSDVSLLVEGTKLPVHKFVLSARSKYFDTLFSLEDSREAADQDGAVSGSQDIVEVKDVPELLVEIEDSIVLLTDDVIEIKNVKLDVVKDVLDYLYEGHYDCHGKVESHFKALELARKLRLDGLEEILINHLIKTITMENFTEFFNLNSRYQNDKLEKTCNYFLEENSEDIIASDIFSKLTTASLLSLLDTDSFEAAEVDIFHAAERWAGVNKPNEETVKDIVNKIRLETISLKDLFRVVKCSKELPSIDIMDAVQSIAEEDYASKNIRKQQNIAVTSSNKVLVSKGATVTGGSSRMNCIDGDEKSCAIVTEDSPLTITLGHPCWLSSLRVKINAYSSNYTIESSPDGESWQPVGGETVDEENLEREEEGVGRVWHTYEFSRRVVLYFRVSMEDLYPPYSCLELWHVESPASTTSVTN